MSKIELTNFFWKIMGRAGMEPPVGDLEEKHMRAATATGLRKILDEDAKLIAKAADLGIVPDAPQAAGPAASAAHGETGPRKPLIVSQTIRKGKNTLSIDIG